MAEAIIKKLEFPHPLVKVQAVDQLLAAARRELKDKQKCVKELDVLWDKCCSSRLVEDGYFCANAIIALTAENLLDSHRVMSTAQNYASSARNVEHLLYIIGKLLQMHVLDKVRTFKGQELAFYCPYNLRAPPHPFIGVITSRLDALVAAESQIAQLLNDALSLDDESDTIFSAMFVMMKPAILYILLNPKTSDKIEMCRHRLLRFMFDILQDARNRESKTVEADVLKVLGPVLAFYEPDINTFSIYEMLAMIESECCCTTMIVLKLLNFCQEETAICDKISALRVIGKILMDNTANVTNFNLIAIGIACILNTCPISILFDTLSLLKSLLEKGSLDNLPSVSVQVLKVPLLHLQLLSRSSSVEKRTVILTKTLFIKLENMETPEQSGTHQMILDASWTKFFTSNIFTARIVHMHLLLNRFSSDYSSVTHWLDFTERFLSSKAIADEVIPTVHILSTLFLYHSRVDSNKTILLQILRCFGLSVKAHPRFSHLVLPILIYTLKECEGKIVQEICYTLPSLASHPYCVAPILNIIRSLSSSPTLRPIALRLILDLWKIQSRCYPELQKILSSLEFTVQKRNETRDFDLIKAVAISELCKERPHQHGSDMLQLISGVLSSFDDGKCEIAIASFALDALYHLCSNKVLNLMTMWEQLGTVLQKKSRGLVASKVLRILSLLPGFKTDSKEYDVFREKILMWIWSNIDMRDTLAIGGALSCLSHYNFTEFQVKHLPVFIRPDRPEGTAEEEFLEKRPAGSCFMQLLLGIEKVNLKDYQVFLTSMLKQELEELPRDIHHRAMKSQLQASQPIPLKGIPDFIMTFYERNKQPSMKACLARSLLLSYTPTVEINSAGTTVPKSIVFQGRKGMDILQALLKEITIDPNDWHSLIWCAHGWRVFMKKCLKSMVEGRRTELGMQKERREKESNDTEEEYQAKYNTALLWCRDKITNALKTASKGNPSMQGNAVFALASLISAANATDNLDEDVLTEIDSEYIKMAHWTTMALDTVMSIANPKYIPSSRIMSWCQYRSVSATGKLSTTQLGRICAVHALPFVAGVAMQKHSGKVLEMLAFLKKSDYSSEENLKFHSSLCLGHILSRLYHEDAYDHLSDDGSILVQECLYVLHNDVEKCLSKSEHPLQDNLGSLLGYGLALSSKFQSSDSSFNAAGRAVLQQLHDLVKKEDLTPDCMQAAFTVLTWTYLAAFTNNVLTFEVVRDLVNVFQDAVKENLSKAGYCESLGTLCNGLFLCGDTSVSDVMNEVYEHWHSLINKESTPTRERVAALTGFCSLVGSNTTLSPVAVDPSMLGASQYLAKLSVVVKTLRKFSRGSTDPGIPTKSVILLGQLFMSLESSSNAIGTILPPSYDYLPSTSILRSSFTYLSEMVRPEAQVRSYLHLTILRGISQNSWNTILPPVNWTALASVILSRNYNDDTRHDVFVILLSQCSHSTSCASLLTSWICPKKFLTLPPCIISLVYNNMDKVIKCQEDLKIAEFLEMVGSHCIDIVEKDDESDIVAPAILCGMAKTMRISNTLSAGVDEMLQNTITRLFLHLPFNCYSKAQVDAMRRLAECAEFLPDANSLVAIYENVKSSPKDSLKSLFLRCCCTLSGTHSLSMCNDTILLCGKHEDIHDDALWIISVCLRGITNKIVSNQIQWLQELMGEISKLIDSPSQEILVLIDYFLTIFAIAVAFWSSAGATLPVRNGYQGECVNAQDIETCRQDCAILLPISIDRLFANESWKSMIRPMTDWLAHISEKLQMCDPDSAWIKHFNVAMCASKGTEPYLAPSIWCRVVSSLFHLG